MKHNGLRTNWTKLWRNAIVFSINGLQIPQILTKMLRESRAIHLHLSYKIRKVKPISKNLEPTHLRKQFMEHWKNRPHVINHVKWKPISLNWTNFSHPLVPNSPSKHWNRKMTLMSHASRYQCFSCWYKSRWSCKK